jgi:hypothetical protein
MFLVVDHKSEMILAHELLDPTDGLAAMYGKVPALLLSFLLKMKVRPKEINIISEVLATLGQALSGRIKVPFIRKKHLPVLKAAKKEIMGFLK